MIAIGIDPGIANTGYAIVSRHNATGNLSVTASGIVKNVVKGIRSQESNDDLFCAV